MTKISPKRKRKEDTNRVLSAEEQEAALAKARADQQDNAKPKRELYRHTIDVPADLAEKIEDELKRTHLSKRGFWLKLAEGYFSKQRE